MDVKIPYNNGYYNQQENNYASSSDNLVIYGLNVKRGKETK